MRLTKSPQWLLEPTESEVRRAARYTGMRELDQDDMDFVLDVLNYRCGVSLARTMYMDGDTRDRARFIEQFPLTRVPGRNVITQAVRMLKLYKLAKHYKQYRRYYYEFDMIMWLIGVLDGMPQIDASGMEMLIRLAGGDGAGEDDENQLAMEIAASQGIDLQEMLRIMRQLDETQAFQTPQGELTPDSNGEDIRVRSMEEMGDSLRISQQSWGLPDSLLYYKALQGDLAVREPVTRHDKKQLLYMLLDGTGSMKGKPVSRAVGVAINALDRVIKGEAEVYLRFFDGKLREQEYHADSPESARELLQVVTDPANYQGGWTEFVQPLHSAGERINDLVREGKFRLPEIVMVTDGEASIPALSDLNGTKLNVVQVGNGIVMDLAKLAEASGGVNIDATTK